jgi:uncharacterized membrane protein YhhN
MNSKYWTYLFVADLLAELTAIAFEWNNIRFITKPLLLIILFAWFITSSKKYLPLRYYIAAALFFSWLGDIFLLNENVSYGFIAGLAGFLIAHIMYILFFLRLRAKQLSPKPWNVFIIAAVIVYASALFNFLYPHIGNLKIPVAVYALAISAMLVTAVHAFKHCNDKAASNCISGAVLFIMSDSLLAVNKFYAALPAAEIFIMLSYSLAQFAITKGSLQYLAGINKSQEQKIDKID